MKKLNSKEIIEETKNEPKKDIDIDKENECTKCKCFKNTKLLNKKTNRVEDEIDLEDYCPISNNKSLNTNSNKININFYLDLIKDSYCNDTGLDNIFSIFKSINDILYIIYANDFQSIILFNFIDNKKINEIKNAHDFPINNFRHYLDKINKRDLIISISSYDNNIKLWNINNIECILNIKNAYKNGEMYSACFLY